MATVYINKELIGQIDPNTSLHQQIKKIENQRLESNEVITQIFLDGKCYDIDQFDESFNPMAKEFTEIDFEVKSNLDLAFEAIESSAQYIDHINKQIDEVVSSYHKNDTENANLKFGQIIDLMDLFLKLVSQVSTVMKNNFSEQDFKKERLENLEIHLLSVVKALLPAKEKEDIIMLCDLLEYELKENLQNWKIHFLTHLKQFKKEGPLLEKND